MISVQSSLESGSYTYLVTSRLNPISQVYALVMTSPANSEIGVHGPHLVLVSGGAFPDLKQGTICDQLNRQR